MTGPPLFILGVRRSGTTLLRVMLDRHSQLAVPDESYFLPQLAERHRGPIRPEAFLDDLRRLPTLRAWGLPPQAVAPRLRPGMAPGEAIAAIYEAYAERQGKGRWGDKTPLYMQYLPLLERLFPTALFVHLIRDGRDAAASFRELPAGLVTGGWARPRGVADFACQWQREVRAARALGRRLGEERYLELRYEALVACPERELSRLCAFLGLEYEPAMLDYPGRVDVSQRPHQRRLLCPPTPGLRDWRRELSPREAAAFQAVAGDLLAELGYEPGAPGGVTPAGRLRRRIYAARAASWRLAGLAVRRSPLWRLRHPPLW